MHIRIHSFIASQSELINSNPLRILIRSEFVGFAPILWRQGHAKYARFKLDYIDLRLLPAFRATGTLPPQNPYTSLLEVKLLNFSRNTEMTLIIEFALKNYSKDWGSDKAQTTEALKFDARKWWRFSRNPHYNRETGKLFALSSL